MKDFLKRYWLFIVAIVYIIVPVDLVPDVIPFLGGLDDATIVILGLIRQYIDYSKKQKAGV